MSSNSPRPERLRHKAWSSESVYADLSSPEWLDDLPLRFWDDPRNHLRYAEWYAIEKKFKSLDGWYGVNTTDVYRRHGASLIQRHGGLFKFLQYVYPGKDWHPWKFRTMPEGLWNKEEWRLKYVFWLGKEIGFKKPEDWYKIKQVDVVANHGRTLYQRFSGELARFARLRYPDFDFKPWLFREVPNGFWEKKKNRVAYVKWLEKKLGFKSRNDWYIHTVKIIDSNRGRSVSNYYRGSLVRMLKDVFPGKVWHEWLFTAPLTDSGMIARIACVT